MPVRRPLALAAPLQVSAPMDWLAQMYGSVLVTEAVARELEQGAKRGIDLPTLTNLSWVLPFPRPTPGLAVGCFQQLPLRPLRKPTSATLESAPLPRAGTAGLPATGRLCDADRTPKR